MGDPAGVGPETIVGAWSDSQLHAFCRPNGGGPAGDSSTRCAIAGQQRTVVELVDSPENAQPAADRIPCLKSGSDDVLDLHAGHDRRARRPGGLRRSGARQPNWRWPARVDAITTAPLHKAALWQAGHHYPGHTELLAELCGVDDFAMMLYLAPGPFIQRRGRAGHRSRHAAHGAGRRFRGAHQRAVLAQGAPRRPTSCGASKARRRGSASARSIRTRAKKDCSATKSKRSFAPPSSAAWPQGSTSLGPLPADTLISRACRGEFDAVVAMYHDQGHIAIKLLEMHRAVNVTLGLPIVRTSVAHGTAFDLAWQGTAETGGMVEAVRVASRIVPFSPVTCRSRQMRWLQRRPNKCRRRDAHHRTGKMPVPPDPSTVAATSTVSLRPSALLPGPKRLRNSTVRSFGLFVFGRLIRELGRIERAADAHLVQLHHHEHLP